MNYKNMCPWSSILVIFLGLLISVLISTIVLFYNFTQFYPIEMLLGLTLTMANFVAGTLINNYAVSSYPLLPVFWGLAMKGLRLLGLGGMIFLFHWFHWGYFNPFLIIVLISYFIFMIGEILLLHFLPVHKVIE